MTAPMIIAGAGVSASDSIETAYATALFHENLAFLRQGDWKLSTLDGIFEESKFELFDLSVDPGETNNLATDEPEKYAELIALWRVERTRLGIILPKDL